MNLSTSLYTIYSRSCVKVIVYKAVYNSTFSTNSFLYFYALLYHT